MATQDIQLNDAKNNRSKMQDEDGEVQVNYDDDDEKGSVAPSPGQLGFVRSSEARPLTKLEVRLLIIIFFFIRIRLDQPTEYIFNSLDEYILK